MPSIKEIYNSIGEVELNAESINLNVDGLEALASTQQADVALIKDDLANGVDTLKNLDFIRVNSNAGTVVGPNYTFYLGYAKRTTNRRWDLGQLYVWYNQDNATWEIVSTNEDDSGVVAYIDATFNNPKNIPPQTGWTFNSGWSGSGFSISYEQPSIQPVSAESLPLPAGAATSANQTTANTSLSNIDTDLGAQADASASSDTGTFSLISLVKRILGTKLPDQSSGRIPVTLASAGTNGSTAPTTANLYGGTDGTNLRAMSVDSNGRPNTNIVSVPSGSVTNRSSTITTGGTSQQVAASNTSRKYFLIQNISDTDMYLGVGYTPTTTTGILLSKNGSGITFESGFIPTSAINILCATTGKAFVALEG
ncbi:MAG: hypothetical protein EBR82_54560 [Caulobacteraceae bacterium]|nr:hypothetical protein [Caulobacteraceae bacterium]